METTAVITAMKNVLTVVIITQKNVIYTRWKMIKIDLDMDYILKMYFSREYNIDLSALSVLVQIYNPEDVQFKIENILKFGDGRKKILAIKLMKLLEMASLEFLKEVDKGGTND